MNRPRFAFGTTLAFCVLLAHTALAGINLVGGEVVSVAPRPAFTLSGDLNNDGKSDIVVVSPNSNEIDVFVADNTPSHFAPARNIQIGNTLGRPVLADLNADNRLDLVVPDHAARSVWILLGKGDGTFLTPYLISVDNSKHPDSVAAANFDDLGNLDLAVGDSALGKVFILINDNGNPPRFRRGGDMVVGLAPDDVRAVDLNGDLKADLLTLNLGGPRVKDLSVVLWKRVTQGFPEFELPQHFTVGENPSNLVVADFNNDDKPDVALLNRTSGGANVGEVEVLLGQGNGILFPPSIVQVPCPFFSGGAPCRPLALAAGDLDGNGNIDLMVALIDPRSLSDAMQAFGGRGDGGFVSGPVFFTQKHPVSMAAGDVTGDGKIDITVANESSLDLQAFVNVSSPGGGGNGDMCLLGDECLSDRCINGVCCADQCDPTLNEKCNVTGREGTCVPVPLNPVTCTLPNAPECTSNEFCVDSFCCDQSCNGGHCNRPGYEGVCIPGIADGQPCSGDNQECSSNFCHDNRGDPDEQVCCREECAGGICDGEGFCHAKLLNGDDCETDNECVSNVCDAFDAICCNRKCDPVNEVCFNVQGICRSVTYTPGPLTPGYDTPVPTPTATPRLTPAPPGEKCSIPPDCTSTFCVTGVCCLTSSCGAGQLCAEGSGVCTDVSPTPTKTIIPTPLPTLPTPNPCGSCPPGTRCEILNGEQLCVTTSSGGGCSTSGDDSAPGNWAVVAFLPLALWASRRWQMRRVRVRARAPRQ